jgi:hypothetical protein
VLAESESGERKKKKEKIDHPQGKKQTHLIQLSLLNQRGLLRRDLPGTGPRASVGSGFPKDVVRSLSRGREGKEHTAGPWRWSSCSS